jgi:hypothetical protein
MRPQTVVGLDVECGVRMIPVPMPNDRLMVRSGSTRRSGKT